MAKPSKPKDIKPKADGDAAASGGGGGGGGLDLKFIITLIVIMLCTTLTSGAAVYFLAPMVLMPAIEEQLKKVAAAPAHGEEGAEGEGEGDEHASKVGMNLELDDFTVNLKEDPSMQGTQYLRAKMSLNIGVPAEEDCYAEHPAEGEHAEAMPIDLKDGKVIGAAIAVFDVDKTLLANEGAAVDPKVACIAEFKDHMGKYIPTIRDVINASLMKRSAGTLATLEGQEALKDEIKESINQFMDEKYKVIRVNFEDFIIQK